jgi:hypothetical protein
MTRPACRLLRARVGRPRPAHAMAEPAWWTAEMETTNTSKRCRPAFRPETLFFRSGGETNYTRMPKRSILG